MNWGLLILVGLVAGVLAKALTPGSNREPRGCLMTIVLGILGSVLVGFIVRAMKLHTSDTLLGTICGATLGAMLLILLMRKVWA